MRGVARLIAVVIFGAGLSGCLNGVQHNDVLIFGTDTKLALDVSASVTSGGTPEVTIGYKRAEAVWMPLVVNGTGVATAPLQPLCVKDDKLAACEAGKPGQVLACVDSGGRTGPCATGDGQARQICQSSVGQTICSFDLQSRKYVGSAETRDGKPVGTDAYSVFASFGANIKGDSAGGSVGLAQFFATGIAAQRLASNSQVANALSVQPPAVGVAMAQASGAQSPEIAQAISDGIKQADKNKTNGGLLAACATIKAPAKLSTVAPATPSNAALTPLYPAFQKALDEARTEADFTRLIAFHRPDFRAEIEATITSCGGAPA